MEEGGGGGKEGGGIGRDGGRRGEKYHKTRPLCCRLLHEGSAVVVVGLGLVAESVLERWMTWKP